MAAGRERVATFLRGGSEPSTAIADRDTHSAGAVSDP
jgi:hypothetical protein